MLCYGLEQILTRVSSRRSSMRCRRPHEISTGEFLYIVFKVGKGLLSLSALRCILDGHRSALSCLCRTLERLLLSLSPHIHKTDAGSRAGKTSLERQD